MEAPPIAPEPAPAAPEKNKVQKIEAIPFKAFAERDLPPREVLFGGHYQRGQGTCSIGQDGAGKSTVSIAETLCMGTARNILGEQPKTRLRVWLHNADDDSTEMRRRIAAFFKLHEISMTELEGWLFVTGKDNFKIKVVRGGNGGSIPDKETIAAIIKTIIENKVDVAIFDPLVHLHAVLENNNNNLAEVAEVFGDIALAWTACRCARGWRAWAPARCG
jgi:RecA-family ATPase